MASAVQEFEAQGVDLTGIIKTASGGDTSRCDRSHCGGWGTADGQVQLASSTA